MTDYNLLTHDIDTIDMTEDITAQQTPIDNSLFNIMYTNADSLSNKVHELTLIAQQDNTKVICISETLPKNVDQPENYVNIELENYNGFHSNTGRGVSIYVRENLKTELLNLNTLFNDHIWVKIYMREIKPVVIGCIYRSPNSNPENNKALIELLEEANNISNSNLVIVGDFNYKEVDWLNRRVHARNEHPASLIYDKINDLLLEQLISEPTRYREGESNNVLDWVITNISHYCENLKLYPPLGEKGDHCIIKFDLDLLPDLVKYGDNYNYYKGNYDKMGEELAKMNWDNLIDQKTVEEAWIIFADILDKLKSEYIPKRAKKMNKRQPWVNTLVKESIKIKNKAFKIYKKDKSPILWENFRKARNTTNHLVQESKHNFELKIAQEIKSNPKQFWNYVKAKNKGNNSFPNMTYENIYATEDKQKADLFNSYFCSVFTTENLEEIPTLDDKSEGKSIENINLTIDMIEKKLDKLNISKAAGPDKIHGKILKELKSQLSEPLYKIFSKSINQGCLPSDWKFAHVKPLYKKGKKDMVSNYRPVSLTSICGKTLERIIRDSLVEYLEDNNFIAKEQHGFRAGRSCTTQLLEIMELWSDFIDRGIAIDCIYLDFAKAFDKVPHYRLIEKLKAYGIKGNILNWIKNFLHNRNQVVIVNNTESEIKPVTSGIPQGSVLGPILFIVYINDLPEVVNSYVRIFADDTKIFKTIQCEQDHDILQQDVVKLIDWSNKWKLKFNVEKCKIIHYGFNNKKCVYYMNELVIKEDICEKDLGVTFDSSLKFSTHIRNIVCKANSRLGLIKRNFTCLNKDVFIPLYKSLIRPLLEYCSSVWNPILKSDQMEIEKVQRRATKLVPCISQLSYSNRLSYLKLDSLAFRRRRTDMIQVFRIIRQIDNIDISNFFELNTDLRTRGHSYKLKKPRALHNLRNNSFALRIINDWNGLRESTVNCTTVNSFKSQLAMEWENHPERFMQDLLGD